jgi:hypothetical protein
LPCCWRKVRERERGGGESKFGLLCGLALKQAAAAWSNAAIFLKEFQSAQKFINFEIRKTIATELKKKLS